VVAQRRFPPGTLLAVPPGDGWGLWAGGDPVRTIAPGEVVLVLGVDASGQWLRVLATGPTDGYVPVPARGVRTRGT